MLRNPAPDSLSSKGRRWLEPLVPSLLALFFVWTALVALLWLSGWGDAQIANVFHVPELRQALSLTVNAADAIWVLLAAVNIYLSLAATEGVRTARRWAVITLAAAWFVAEISARFGIPLGHIRYTERLGRHVGSVPIALPFLWFAILFGARGFALRAAPRASHSQIALLTGIFAMLADCNLERVASSIRVWWLWRPLEIAPPKWPPATTFITWLCVCGALGWLFREQKVAPKPDDLRHAPALIFLLLNIVFGVADFWK